MECIHHTNSFIGGGFGGKKESGQLRFGCLDRPWKRTVQHQQEEWQYSVNTPTCATHKHHRTESSREPQKLHENVSDTKNRSLDIKYLSHSKRSQSKRYSIEDFSENRKRRKI